MLYSYFPLLRVPVTAIRSAPAERVVSIDFSTPLPSLIFMVNDDDDNEAFYF